MLQKDGMAFNFVLYKFNGYLPLKVHKVSPPTLYMWTANVNIGPPNDIFKFQCICHAQHTHAHEWIRKWPQTSTHFTSISYLSRMMQAKTCCVWFCLFHLCWVADGPMVTTQATRDLIHTSYIFFHVYEWTHTLFVEFTDMTLVFASFSRVNAPYGLFVQVLNSGTFFQKVFFLSLRMQWRYP